MSRRVRIFASKVFGWVICSGSVCRCFLANLGLALGALGDNSDSSIAGITSVSVIISIMELSADRLFAAAVVATREQVGFLGTRSG